MQGVKDKKLQDLAIKLYFALCSCPCAQNMDQTISSGVNTICYYANARCGDYAVSSGANMVQYISSGHWHQKHL